MHPGDDFTKLRVDHLCTLAPVRDIPMAFPRVRSSCYPEGNLSAAPKRLTENELSDFSRLWHGGCAKQSSRHNMWTEITRRKYQREGQRYASDLTDAEWALIEPHMPPAKRLGRPRETELRDVLDAILYIARTGCQWRMLPKEFPPF